MMNIHNYKKPAMWEILTVTAMIMTLGVGCSVNRINQPDFDIPDITAVEEIDGVQAKALLVAYSRDDGENGVVTDSIPTWQGEYAKVNTLVIDGEMGANMIALSADNPTAASYIIYLPDGTVFDNGKRELYDSQSSRLYWSVDGPFLIAPRTAGKYIYEVTLEWEQDSLMATYGIKVVMTGKRNAYDEALSIIENEFGGLMSVSLKDLKALPGMEGTDNCYIFEIELSDGMAKAAVSKKDGTLFIYSNGEWQLKN